MPMRSLPVGGCWGTETAQRPARFPQVQGLKHSLKVYVGNKKTFKGKPNAGLRPWLCPARLRTAWLLGAAWGRGQRPQVAVSLFDLGLRTWGESSHISRELRGLSIKPLGHERIFKGFRYPQNECPVDPHRFRSDYLCIWLGDHPPPGHSAHCHSLSSPQRKPSRARTAPLSLPASIAPSRTLTSLPFFFFLS